MLTLQNYPPMLYFQEPILAPLAPSPFPDAPLDIRAVKRTLFWTTLAPVLLEFLLTALRS